jgi:hypothetical protein
MKKVFILVAFGVISVTQLCFSQIIRINVSQVQDAKIDSVYDVDYFDVINNSANFVSSPYRNVNVSYEFDLTSKQFKYYYRGNLETEGDIVFSNTGSLHTIYFLIEGYHIGMIVNCDARNEYATWFFILGDYLELSKFSKFEIVKGS